MDSRFVHRFVRSQSRHGGVLVIVLFTMMAVAFLASQGVRLMMLHNLNSDQRIKTAQLNELIELGRMRLASREVAEEFLVEVPDRFGSPAPVLADFRLRKIRAQLMVCVSSSVFLTINLTK